MALASAREESKRRDELARRGFHKYQGRTGCAAPGHFDRQQVGCIRPQHLEPCRFSPALKMGGAAVKNTELRGLVERARGGGGRAPPNTGESRQTSKGSVAVLRSTGYSCRRRPGRTFEEIGWAPIANAADQKRGPRWAPIAKPRTRKRGPRYSASSRMSSRSFDISLPRHERTAHRCRA